MEKKSDKTIELQTYSIKRPFGVYRLLLTDILSDIVVNAPNMLDQIPLATWRILSCWFLEYRFNNLYHFHFWKIYQVMIRENHVESQKILFSKCKFLSKMIDHYRSSEPSGLRGFILVMCNMVRFAADIQPPTGFFKHYLTSHDSWKQFVSQLRADTQTQQKRYDDLIYTPDMGDEEYDDEADNGVDLGSVYARSLGFEETTPFQSPDSPRNKKKKRKPKKKKSLNSSVEEVDIDDNNKSPMKNEVPANSPNKKSSPKQEDISEETSSEESSQGMDWWKDMVDDFKHEDEIKDETSSDDWWKELKSELHSMESDDRKHGKEVVSN